MGRDGGGGPSARPPFAAAGPFGWAVWLGTVWLGPVWPGVASVAANSPGADGQKSASRQRSQRGDRAVQVARPWRIRRRLNAPRWAAGIMGSSAISILTGSVSSVSSNRWDRRCTWVSTGRPGARSRRSGPRWPSCGRRRAASPGPPSGTGTWPSNRVTNPWAMPTRLRDLARKNPVERINSSSSPRSAAAKEAASGYRAKSAGVVMLTRASVHWAERMVATRARRDCGGPGRTACGPNPGYSSPNRSSVTRARPAGVRGRAIGGETTGSVLAMDGSRTVRGGRNPTRRRWTRSPP